MHSQRSHFVTDHLHLIHGTQRNIRCATLDLRDESVRFCHTRPVIKIVVTPY